MKIKKNYLICGILVFVFVLMLLPWLREGTPVTDDYRHHASRIWFVQEEISQKTFSEWMPYSYGGWPFFHFYHPFFYIVSLPVLLIFNAIATLKAMTVITFLIALLGTFYGVNLLFKDKELAVFAAVAYSLSSHFLFHATVSGALPRLLAIALTPLAMCLFIKAIEDNNRKISAVSGILLGVLIMTHVSVAIPALIICGIYLVANAIMQKNCKSLLNGALIFAIAIGISSVWLAPLFFEKEYASLPNLNSLEAPYPEQTTRTFGIVNDGTKFIRSNYFGYSIIALSILGLFLLRKNKTINLLKIGMIASVILYFNLFGILNVIPYINSILTGSTAFFIGALVFNAVILAALCTKALANNFRKEYLIYIILALIIFELYPGTTAFTYDWINQPTENFVNPPQLIDAWKWISNQPGNFAVLSPIGQAAEIYHGKQEFGADWVGCPQCVQAETYAVHNEIYQNFTNGNIQNDVLGYFGVKYYVLPCQTQLPNKLAYTNNAVCVYENDKVKPLIESKSDAKIDNINYKMESISFSTESQKETSVIIKTNYFKPHWHAYIDGKETTIQKAWPEFMSVNIPAGQHEVEIKYKTNSLHLLAWFITFLTAIGAWLMMKNGRNAKQTKQ